jgi:hypothetical protein
MKAIARNLLPRALRKPSLPKWNPPQQVAGQKVSEWLRYAALAQARKEEEHTDPIPVGRDRWYA